MNPLILSSMCQIVPLLFFYKDGVGIKLPQKVDMPLKKETKENQDFRIRKSKIAKNLESLSPKSHQKECYVYLSLMYFKFYSP